MSRWRHKKRGTTYTLLHTAVVQVPEGDPLVEGEVVEVYQSEDNQNVYVRRQLEFHDGRFDKLHLTGRDGLKGIKHGR